MQRVILSPATLPSSALAELKQWLGITTTRDDAPLSALLRAALQTCEAFTGRAPIEMQCEEVLRAETGWQSLATRPVTAITALDGLTAQAERFILTPGTYDFELDADGRGRVRLTQPGAAVNLAVRFTAGIADQWDDLPDGLRHGMMRLAAHQHRERDGQGAAPIPPASVAALWRPWRRMRLA